MSKTNANKKDDPPKKGYSYYVDTSSFAKSDRNQLSGWITELIRMVQSSSERETFYCPGDWREAVTGDGYNLTSIIYETNDYKYFELAEYVTNKLERIETLSDLVELDKRFTVTHNAFIGIAYPPEIKTDRHIETYQEKVAFTKSNPIHEEKLDFWQYREQLFPHLHFLKLDEKTITGGTYRSIFEKLFRDMERYCTDEWKSGPFNKKELRSVISSVIKDESETVDNNKNMRKERENNIPEIGKVYCPLHIRKNDLRIYFWPYEEKREIFIVSVETQHPKSKRFG